MSHIGFAERVAIEAGLARHESLAAIANQINVQPRAVSEEIRKNRSLLPSARYNGKDCKFADDCRRRFVCGNIRRLGKLVNSTKFNAKFKTFHNNILLCKKLLVTLKNLNDVFDFVF